jgi:universal stress protein A
MKRTTKKQKVVETAAGAAIGAAIAGPVGAVAGGLATTQLNPTVTGTRRRRRPKPRAEDDADDPLIHARLKRILVPLDFSTPSKRAMRFAREWALRFAAEVYLLHVIDPTIAGGEFGGAPLGTVQRDLAGKAKLALSQLAREEFPDSLSVKLRVRKGTASDEIAAAARESKADLVIIASHGYTGLKRVLLGSTAEAVARRAPCPVLILRRRKTP